MIKTCCRGLIGQKRYTHIKFTPSLTLPKENVLWNMLSPILGDVYCHFEKSDVTSSDFKSKQNGTVVWIFSVCLWEAGLITCWEGKA